MTRRGLSGDFWTGALVAFVATPCTGPFMAAALGSAFVLPLPAAVAVFAGLGLGIALPFLMFAYVPSLRRHLPRPGAWMERVRRWLSLPMFMTAAGLLWLLWRQARAEGLAVGVIAALICGVALWNMGRSQGNGSRKAWMPIAACLLALVCGAAVLHLRSAPNSIAVGGFSERALTSARASGKPLFVYFTADWCLSCKANEAAAIDRESVRDAFDHAGVKLLVGDWTSGDPAITRFLEQHGRSGVPLYLWYPARGGQPRVLPQILSPDLLIGLAKGA
jgi:thiol:disulfide interchange protein